MILTKKINWLEEGEKLKELVINKMEKSLLPDLKNNIVEDFYLTPDYFEKDLATLHGSGFSIQPKPTRAKPTHQVGPKLI